MIALKQRSVHVRPCAPVWTSTQRAKQYLHTNRNTKAHATSQDANVPALKVFVAGATGGCGKEVVKALVEKGVPVKALVRDIQKAGELSIMSGVDVVPGDVFQFSTLPPAAAECNAMIIATGARDVSNPLGPFNVDYQGTLNLLSVAQKQGMKQVVLISSIGADELFNPLNLFWGVLFWKKRAEEAIQRSGVRYTIVRPGGLKSTLQAGEVAGNIVMAGPNTYGFPPQKKSGSILRSQVAEVAVEALYIEAALDKVVEVIAETSAPKTSIAALFESV